MSQFITAQAPPGDAWKLGAAAGTNVTLSAKIM
jgi:hypothetical protein